MYEPLLEIFEGGGTIDLHHGELIVDNTWASSLRNWIERYSSQPMPELVEKHVQPS